MNAETTLSLVIPVQQDEAGLPLLVHEALGILPNYFADFEIILVDTGSDECTMQVAARLAAANDSVAVLHPRRTGYGAALLHAFRAARGDYLLVMDADRRLTISDIARFVPFIGTHDIVVGYPAQSDVTAQRSVHNLIRRLFDLDVHDLLSQMVLLRAHLLQALHLQTTGPLLLIEILAKARLRGAAIHEVAIHSYAEPEEEQQIITLGNVWQLWRIVGHYHQHNDKDQRRSWRQRALLASTLAALLGGIFMLRRRR